MSDRRNDNYDDEYVDLSSYGRRKSSASGNSGRKSSRGGSSSHRSSSSGSRNRSTSGSRSGTGRSTGSRSSSGSRGYSSRYGGTAAGIDKSYGSIEWQIRHSPSFVFKKIGFVLLTLVIIGAMTAAISAVIYLYNITHKIDSSINFDLTNLKINLTSMIYVKDPETDKYIEYKELHASAGNRIWVDIDDIPDNMKNAFIAIEDKRFEKHHGVDWGRTVFSFGNMVFGFSSSQQGGSTITQQLIKNLTGDNQTTPERKIQEIRRALQIEKEYSKDDILECYLNTINLDGRFGVQTAARYYFGKDVKDLDICECAAIAAITKSPTYYNPITNPEHNKERRNLVLWYMHDQGKITDAEYEKAIKEELKLVGKETAKSAVSDLNNYYIDLLIDDVIDDLQEEYGYTENIASDMLYTGGLRIYANMDSEIQDILDKSYVKDDDLFARLYGDTQPQSAMMIMDYSGSILGVAGGRGAKTTNRGLNRVVSPRQSGSSIKPLSAYAPALEEGLINYSSTVNDKPLNIKVDNEYWPKNFSQYYSGYVSLQYAIEVSLNTIPAQLIQKMSLKTSYDYLIKNFHLSTLVENDMAYSPLATGSFTHGVTVKDMTAAYASFGNLGTYYKPSTYSKITDSKGKVVLEQDHEGSRAVGEDTAYIMNKLLQKVVTEPAGTGNMLTVGNGNVPIFAKTGTTNDYKDLWVVAGTPDYVAGVWYGYDKNERTLSYNNHAPHQAWSKVMKRIYAVKTIRTRNFPQTDKVEARYYCTSTGKLATSACGSKAVGYYQSDNLPAKCSHGGSLLPKISGGTGNSKIGSTDDSISKDLGNVSIGKTTEKHTEKPASTTKKGSSEGTTSHGKTTESPSEKPTQKPTKPSEVKTTVPKPTKPPEEKPTEAPADE